MLAAGFAAFFTGVTEPLEFSFMFVALLYMFYMRSLQVFL